MMDWRQADMSNSEAVAVVQGMLAQQRKQDAAEWAAYQEARRKEAQQEKEALQELLWQLDMDSAKVALALVGMVFALTFLLTALQ